MQGYLYYTKEEREQAAGVHILTYLESTGRSLVKVGHDYCTDEHDSLRIDPDTQVWNWYSRKIGGKGAVDYAIKVDGLSAPEAVKKIIKFCAGKSECRAQSPPRQKAKALMLPPAETGSLKQLYGYLCQLRGIDKDIVKTLVRQKSIYLSREPKGRKVMHNVVFVGYDQAHVPRYAERRGTLSSVVFRPDCSGSDKSYGFLIKGKSDRLYVFEAPIEALSFATLETLRGIEWTQHTKLSQGCLDDAALERYLKANHQTKHILFGYNNDGPGRETARIHAKKYKDRGYDVSIRLPSPDMLPKGGKDYNDCLISVRKNQSKVRYFYD